MTKKLIGFLLILIIALGVIPIQSAATGNYTNFSDVKSNDWFAEAVQYVYNKGLMVGTSDSKFSPNDTTTRGQIVTILYRMEGSPEVSDPCGFNDVEAGSWYESPIIWAAQHNIVKGTSPTTYAPVKNITRQEMVAILYRYSIYKGYDTNDLASLDKFSDAGKISSWAVTPMRWSVANGLISGVNSRTIAPAGTATRAQAASILMRFCESVGKDELYAQFKEKNIEDFPNAEVINLDESTETNFAVLSDKTVATETSDEKNRLVGLDRENGIYQFENVDEEIAALEPGDILYHVYGPGETDYIIAKVGVITHSKTGAEIKAADSDPSDIFQYVDIDMDIEVPASSANSYQNTYSDISLLAQERADLSKTFDYSGNMAGIDVTASATITLHISWHKWGVFIDQIKVTVKTDSEVHADFEKRTENKPYRVDYPSTPIVNNGIIQGTINTFLVCNFNAGVEGHADGELHTESGIMLDASGISTVNECTKDFSAKVKGEFESNIGIGIRANVTLLWIMDIGIDTEGGLDVIGKIEKSAGTQKPTEKHECVLCLEGTVTPYIQLTGYIRDHSSKPQKHPFKETDYYLSYRVAGLDDIFEFGWGECPHKRYLVTIATMDSDGAPVTNQLVSVVGLHGDGRTD